MKVYTLCSPSHEVLLEKWLDSTVNEPEIEPHIVYLDMETGNGDFQNHAWPNVLRAWYQFVINAIMDNHGRNIGITGSDVVFVRPFLKEISRWLLAWPVLMQCEIDETLGGHVNPDVMFIKCDDDTLRMFWMLAELDSVNDIKDQNVAIRQCFPRYMLRELPTRYASWSNNGLELNPNECVLFHANCTPSDENGTSMEKKLRMLKEIGH